MGRAQSKLLASFAVATLLACSQVWARDTLRVLAWPGYADPEVVEPFAHRHDVDVAVTYVDSDDDLWAKVNASGAGGFDVFAVNTAELQRYIDAGISVPLRLEHIPNHAHQLKRFQQLEAIPGLVRDGKIYGIPYTYSAMGLIYNRKMLAEAPSSMRDMWDPQYQRQVLAFDTSNHNFSVAALAFGAGDPFHLDEAGFEATAKKLIALRRNVLTFYRTPEEVVELFGSNEIALIFGNYGTQQVAQLRAAGADIGYVIPDEGALAWIDCWSITRQAKSATLAEAWINFMLTAQAGEHLSERHALANTTSRIESAAEDDKIIWLQPLEDYARRKLLWEKIRAGDSFESLF